MTFYCEVIYEQNTSKIKNQRLNYKTTELERIYPYFK